MNRLALVTAAIAAAFSFAPLAAQPDADLAAFETAFGAGRYDEAERVFDRMAQNRRGGGRTLAPDPLLSGLAGRVYLVRGWNDFALAYLERARGGDVPVSQRRAAAIALAGAQLRAGRRAEALALLRALPAGEAPASEGAAAALAEAEALMLDDPRSALARVQTALAAPAPSDRFAAEILSAQAQSLLGDRAAAAAAADRAWALAAALPAQLHAPLRAALIRAGLASLRGDTDAVVAMLNAAGSGTAELRTRVAQRLPLCGDGGLTASDHATFAVLGGPRVREELLPLGASRPGAVAPFAEALAGEELLERSGWPAAGVIVTLRCRSDPTSEYPAELSSLPFVRWFAARGLFFPLVDENPEALARRVGAAEQRLGTDHPALIPIRAELAQRLAEIAEAEGVPPPFEAVDLRRTVEAAMRGIGGAEEALFPEAVARLEEAARTMRTPAEAIRSYRAGAPAVIDALPLERAYAFATTWLDGDVDLPDEARRAVLERLAARFPAGSRDPRRRALLVRLAAAHTALGDRRAARAALLEAGTPPRSCALAEEAPAILEGSIADSDYPETALENGYRGLTMDEYALDASGRVVGHRLLVSEPSGIFDAVTIERIGAFRFAPARSGGRAIACTGRAQRVIWRLPDETTPRPPSFASPPPRRI